MNQLVSFLVSSLDNLGSRYQINDQKKYKEKARKEELIYMPHVYICYIIGIKKNYLICCSDSR